MPHRIVGGHLSALLLEYIAGAIDRLLSIERSFNS